MRKINSQLPVAAGRVLLRHLEAHFPAFALIPISPNHSRYPTRAGRWLSHNTTHATRPSLDIILSNRPPRPRVHQNYNFEIATIATSRGTLTRLFITPYAATMKFTHDS